MKLKHYLAAIILCSLWLFGCYLHSVSAPTKINGATDIYDHTITGLQINTNSDVDLHSVTASGTVKAPTFESATGAFSFSPSAGYWLGTNGIGTTGTAYPNSYLVSEILDGDPGAGLFLRNASGTKVLAALFSREGIATKLSSAYLGVDTTTGNPVTGFTSSIVMADSGYKTTIIPNSGASANVQITLPAASGTLALTSGIIMPTLDQVTTAGPNTLNAVQTGPFTAIGNITATAGFFFEGDGSHLTGISSIPKLNTSQVMYMDDATNTISIGASDILGVGTPTLNLISDGGVNVQTTNASTARIIITAKPDLFDPDTSMIAFLTSDYVSGPAPLAFSTDEGKREAAMQIGGSVTGSAGYDGKLTLSNASGTTMFSVDSETGDTGVAGKTIYYGDGSNLTGLPAPTLQAVSTAGATSSVDINLTGNVFIGTDGSGSNGNLTAYSQSANNFMRYYAATGNLRGGECYASYCSNTHAKTGSITWGDRAYNAGQNSQAFGYLANGQADYSMAAGYQAYTASGETHSFALGYQSFVNKSGAYALGFKSNATANYATAIGPQTTASGESSTAIGHDIECTGANTICLGANSSVPTLLVSNAGGGTNSGNVSIGNGNTEPVTARLEVHSTGASGTVDIHTTNTASGDSLYVTQDGTGKGGRIDMNNTGTTSVGFTVLQKGVAESIWSYHTGTAGQAGLFQVMNTDNANQGLQGYTKGYGNAIVGHILTEYNDTYCANSYTCNAGWFWNSGTSGTTGNGSSIFAEISNPSHQGVTNPDPLIRGEHHGAGDLLYLSSGATSQTKMFQVETDGDTYVKGHISSGMAVQSGYQIALTATSTVAGLLINQDTADGSTGATGLEINLTKANNANEALWINNLGTGHLINSQGNGASDTFIVTNDALVQAAAGVEVGANLYRLTSWDDSTNNGRWAITSSSITSASSGTYTFPHAYSTVVSCVCSFYNSDTPTSVVSCGVKALSTSSCQWQLGASSTGTVYINAFGY